MQTHARIIQASHDLRRRVYATLPWNYRLASLLFELRMGGTAEDLGRTAYGIFLLYGVTNMPETPFTPKTTREIGRLPKSYGADFGKKLEKVVKGYTYNHKEDTEDVLALLWTKLLSDPALKRLLEGKPLNEAEKIVYTTVRNLATNKYNFNKKKLRNTDLESLVEEPASADFSKLDTILLESEKEDIIEELERLGKGQLGRDLPLYFKLLVDGYTNTEIAENQMLPSMKENPMTQQGLARYRKEIERVLTKRIEREA